jgi:hypothetical protein
LFRHQKRCSLEILKKFEMEHCNDAITSAKSRLQLSKSEDEQDVHPTQWRRLSGSLRYLCNMRPNLVFSVDTVSRFMKRPKVSHLEVVKRILRYAKGLIGCKILFPLQVCAENAICSILLIPIGAEIKLIKSLQLYISLCSVKHQSHGV